MTRDCSEWDSQTAFYLDGELRGEELEAFEAHIQSCSTCRGKLEAGREFVEAVRSARPLHTAPESLRLSVAKILREGPELTEATPGLRGPVDGIVQPGGSGRSFWNALLQPRYAIPLAALAALLMVMLPLSIRQLHANAFNQVAFETHRERLSETLPLELQSKSPAEISAWFSHKVQFAFRLPEYTPDATRPAPYELQGARLVSFRGKYAAYVGYRMRGKPISLLVTSDTLASAAGGERVSSDGLVFHSRSLGDYRVITWSVHHLTYVLVSDVSVPARQSCVVCHADTKGHELLKKFNAKTVRKFTARLAVLHE